MPDLYKFSIVIPCLNEEDYIARCIDSILEQDYDQNFIEIVIVDGLSEDKTREIIADYQTRHNNVKLYDNPAKKTPISLNIGIKNAEGNVVVILGAHTKIDKDFVKYNNKYLIEKDVMVTGGTQKNVGLTYKQSLIGQVMEMPFAMASAQYRWSKKEQFVDTVVYAAYKKELFDEVGYFEEKFAISEDAEFNWRIRQKGYKIWYSPKIKTDYYPRKSVYKFVKQMFRYGILRVNVVKKHTDALTLKHMVPVTFVLLLTGLLIGGIFAPEVWNYLIYVLGGYFSISLIATLSAVFPKKMQYFPAIPFLVFCMHFAWGLGFIIGWLLPKSDKW